MTSLRFQPNRRFNRLASRHDSWQPTERSDRSIAVASIYHGRAEEAFGTNTAQRLPRATTVLRW